MVEAWKHEPGQKKEKKKKKKKGGRGKDFGALLSPSLSLPPKFFKPGLQGVQGLININIQPSKVVFPPPPPHSHFPLLTHKAPPSFRLRISLCIIIGE